MSSSLMPSRCLTTARRLLPCAATSTVSGAQVGGDVGVPVGQHPLDDVLEALGARQVGAEVGVPRVAGLGELVVVGDGGGGTSKDRRQSMNCSSPNSSIVCFLFLPWSPP